jgi:hypothetical protein
MMKVKDMIRELQALDPELTVVITDGHNGMSELANGPYEDTDVDSLDGAAWEDCKGMASVCVITFG